jgi:hypothetical protein
MSNRYAVGADSNNTNSWSTTSGGASGASVPTSDDLAIMDANSISMTLTADLTCLGFQQTAGFTGTLTRTNKLIIYSGGLTLGANGILAGAGALYIMASCTITSNGKLWNNTVNIDGLTVTLADNMTIGNLMGANTIFFNGNTLKIKGNLDCNVVRGTSIYSYEGTGYINTALNFGFYNTDLVINTAGEVELRNIGIRSGSITITSAGSLDITNNFVSIYQTGTFNLGGYKLGTLSCTLNSNNTYTINGSVAKFVKILANYVNATHSYIGTHGWEADAFIQAKTVTLKAGNTYKVNNLIENIGAKLQSGTPLSDAYLNVFGYRAFAGVQEIIDINSSGGDRLYTYDAILTRATNWQNITGNQANNPDVTEVEAGVVYDHGNKIGTLVVPVPDYPAEANVRDGIEYGEGAEGSLIVPAAADVRKDTPVDAGSGTLAVPLPSQVLKDVPTDDTVGTYEPPVPDYPAEANVRDGIEYGEGAEGSLIVPAAADVRKDTPVDAGLGTLAVPLPSQVLKDVPTDDTVGTYEPPVPDYPAETNVRDGIEYGDGAEGSLIVPAADDVRKDTPVDAGVGSLAVPDPAQVLKDIPTDDTVGTYDVLEELPAESDVRKDVAYYSGAKTGTCAVPVPADVLEGVSVDHTVGTLVLRIISKLLSGSVQVRNNISGKIGRINIKGTLRNG